MRDAGLDLSVWVSHNGTTGFNMDWVREQGWAVGGGPGSYSGDNFVVMMQPDFEEAVAQRFEQIVGRMEPAYVPGRLASN